MASMQSPDEKYPIIWKESNLSWASLIVTLALIAFIFHEGLAEMVYIWANTEEYGYGFLIILS